MPFGLGCWGAYDSFSEYVTAPIGRPKRDRSKNKAQRVARRRNRGR